MQLKSTPYFSINIGTPFCLKKFPGRSAPVMAPQVSAVVSPFGRAVAVRNWEACVAAPDLGDEEE